MNPAPSWHIHRRDIRQAAVLAKRLGLTSEGPATVALAGSAGERSSAESRATTAPGGFLTAWPGDDAWRRALDLLRLQREPIAVSHPELAWQCGNMHAGSILFLEPGTAYEVQLTLRDPDHACGADSSQAAVVARRRRRVATKTPPASLSDRHPAEIRRKTHNGIQSVCCTLQRR